MATDEKKLNLKLLIDKKSNKVLYAEAGKDVVDFLFGLLALPLGKVSSLLLKEGMVGCVATLHNSLMKLDGSYIASNQMKNTLLGPPCGSSSLISSTSLLLGSSSYGTNKRFYRCNRGCGNISEKYGDRCRSCRNDSMSTEMQIMSSETVSDGGVEGGCVKGVVTYSVMDDLTVVPMSTISSITLLNKFNIKDLTALEEKSVFLGLQEALELLKASMQSKTVLTNVFLGTNNNGA